MNTNTPVFDAGIAIFFSVIGLITVLGLIIDKIINRKRN